tara:strand:- start:382 stop:615 length:234 start_codon:yes stop_codon:yes gene_type:complete
MITNKQNKGKNMNEEQEIRCFGVSKISIDNMVLTRTKEDRTMLVLSILSDAQETSNPIVRNQWINKAKYIVSRYIGE